MLPILAQTQKKRYHTGTERKDTTCTYKYHKRLCRSHSVLQNTETNPFESEIKGPTFLYHY